MDRRTDGLNGRTDGWIEWTDGWTIDATIDGLQFWPSRLAEVAFLLNHPCGIEQLQVDIVHRAALQCMRTQASLQPHTTDMSDEQPLDGDGAADKTY